MEETERAQHLKTLAETPARLKAALKGVSKKLGAARPAPGKWSILEIVCHMRDMEAEAYLARYRRILAEDNPSLPDIDGDAIALERDYRSQSLPAVLREWSKLRKENLKLLKKVKGGQWERIGTHATAGRFSVADFLRRQAVGNDEAHLGQVDAALRHFALLTRLAAGPGTLAEAVKDLASAAAAAQRSADGKWSIVENACHMRDIELVFAERFTKMAFSERPAFWMLDNDRVAATKKYRDADLGAAVKSFKELRQETLTLLKALPAASWRRTGLHPKRGELSIEQLAEHLGNHDDKHIARIRELRSS